MHVLEFINFAEDAQLLVVQVGLEIAPVLGHLLVKLEKDVVHCINLLFCLLPE